MTRIDNFFAPLTLQCNACHNYSSPFRRQASRTDSIYTLRPTNPNYKRSIFCFRKKNTLIDEAEAKHRTVVPNHTGAYS